LVAILGHHGEFDLKRLSWCGGRTYCRAKTFFYKAAQSKQRVRQSSVAGSLLVSYR
jgi:hypothetical protein